MIDLIAHDNVTSSTWLSKEQRYKLANVLHHACIIEGKKTTVLAAIDIMTDSFKRYVIDDRSTELSLPTILPIEELGLIRE